MAKFGRSGKREVPGLTTASMSDIVFMLLFFFMVTTQLRETENKVMVRLPEASQSAKLERKDLAAYINVGPPTRNLQAHIATERESKSEADRQFMTVSIKADENVRMGIITDIKQELRRCSALKIMYAARKPSQD